MTVKTCSILCLTGLLLSNVACYDAAKKKADEGQQIAQGIDEKTTPPKEEDESNKEEPAKDPVDMMAGDSGAGLDQDSEVLLKDQNLQRPDLPPRAAFAKEDEQAFASLLAVSDEMALNKIAEIFQYQGFRAAPVDKTKIKSEATPKVLLLELDAVHMAKAINTLATAAKKMTQSPDLGKTRSRSLLKVVSVAKGGKTLQFDEPQQHADFMEVLTPAADSKMATLWPEGKEISFRFGSELKVTFVFPSVFSRTTILSPKRKDIFSGKTLLQTPWMLRALEGEALQGVLVSDISFERTWDERSAFFPQPETFMTLKDGVQAFLDNLHKSPGFTFQNS